MNRIEVVRNTSMVKIVGYLQQLTEIYPLLFESTVGVTFMGSPCLYLRDKQVTLKPFVFVENAFGCVELKMDDTNNNVTIALDTLLEDGEIGGTFMMMDDLELPDSICVQLFDYNINIRYSVRGAGKMEIIQYDREAIIRRHTIANIIHGTMERANGSVEMSQAEVGKMVGNIYSNFERQYVSNLVKDYPTLFRLGGKNEEQLFFKEEYKEIYDSALNVGVMGLQYEVTPVDSISFQLRITFALGKPGGIPNRLWITQELSDALCVALYDMNFEIMGLDKEMIIRRHTIENIVN